MRTEGVGCEVLLAKVPPIGETHLEHHFDRQEGGPVDALDLVWQSSACVESRGMHDTPRYSCPEIVIWRYDHGGFLCIRVRTGFNDVRKASNGPKSLLSGSGLACVPFLVALGARTLLRGRLKFILLLRLARRCRLRVADPGGRLTRATWSGSS